MGDGGGRCGESAAVANRFSRRPVSRLPTRGFDGDRRTPTPVPGFRPNRTRPANAPRGRSVVRDDPGRFHDRPRNGSNAG